ncbi:hypothetical protein [Oceanobacillus sp. FSL W7-1293]|uniref:hypothetical protein n=1 Tax=Oceanobacillus sp. FSL W7-1293 TaxID=2921699 RepID=UPI0030D1673A
MTSFKERARYARFKKVLGAILVMPIIAVLGFLDVIPVSNAVSWLALAAFIVSLIVFFVSFKGKKPQV